MAIQAPTSGVPAELFLTLIVDSYVPFHLIAARLGDLLQLNVQRAAQGAAEPNNTRLRVSYILYSSADSAGSPVLKDVYFLPHNDSLILYRSLLQQRNSSPIARTLPDGSSASLEALVRAIENYHLLETLEPGKEGFLKHIVWITGPPPDESQRPVRNNCEEFDGFGWAQCAEWLKKRSIELSLICTRSTIHPQYHFLYTSMHSNVIDIENMPREGPVRYMWDSKVLPIMGTKFNRNPAIGASATQAAPSTSPAGLAGSSPAGVANAASPSISRKRKVTEESQISPKRSKLPSGTGPVTSTPPVPSTITPVPATANNIATTRPASVNSMRPAAPIPAASIKVENTPAPLTVNPQPNTGNSPKSRPSSVPAISSNQAQAAAYLLSTPTNATSTSQASSSSMTQPTFPPSTQQQPLHPLHPLMAANHPTSHTAAQNPPFHDRFFSLTSEQRDKLQKALILRTAKDAEIRRYESEGRLADPKAQEAIRVREEVQQYLQAVAAALQPKQNQDPNGRDNAPSNSTTAQSQLPVSAVEAPTRAQQLAATVTNLTGPGASPTKMSAQVVPAGSGIQTNHATNPAMENISAPVASSAGVNGALQPAPGLNSAVSGNSQVNHPAWRGFIQVMRNSKQIFPDVFIALVPVKGSPSGLGSLSSWPQRLVLNIARVNADANELHRWLLGNSVDPLFYVRLGVDAAMAKRTPSAAQGALQNLASLQTAIVTNKIVLFGKVDQPRDGSIIMLFHGPDHPNGKLAMARFSGMPNLNTLPGAPPVSVPSTNIKSTLAQEANRPQFGALSGMKSEPLGVAGGPGLNSNANLVGNVGANTNPMTNTPALGNQGAMTNPAGNLIPESQLSSHTANNPVFLAQLQRLRAQQGAGGAIAGISGLGIPGQGANTGGGGNATGLSGANLLDRLGSGPLHHGGPLSGSNMSTENALSAGRAGGQSLDPQQQRRLLALATQNGGGTGMGANNTYASRPLNLGGNNMFGTQPAVNNQGAFNHGQSGLNTGGMPNATPATGNLGLANMAARPTSLNQISQADFAKLNRASAVIANQMNISHKEAFGIVLQKSGWTGGATGPGAGTNG